MMAPAMRRDAWIALSLAAIVCAIWTPSLHGSFQFDDWNVIVHESRVHSISAWWQSMPGIRPVLKLSYALNYELGSGVVGFRFVNVALHACNAVLVFLLLQLLSREIPLTGARESTSTRTTLAAATAALLFALHPVQSDAVTYISGRSSVLAGSFSLLALFLWARGPTRLNWLSLACFALALGVKETALALPLIVTLWWAVGRSARHSTNGADMYSLRPRPLLTSSCGTGHHCRNTNTLSADDCERGRAPHYRRQPADPGEWRELSAWSDAVGERAERRSGAPVCRHTE